MGAVFLDLDGTLSDSARPITASIAHALDRSGVAVPEVDTLRRYVGPPLSDTFAHLGVADVETALAAYRAHYHAIMFDAPVFDGVFAALDVLKAQNRRLYLMTAKPRAYAIKITAHLGLAEYLTAEYGPELDGTGTRKSDLLARALAETGEEAGQSVMVGDRAHDLQAGQANDMPVIAALWGYGSDAEMQGANRALHHPADLSGAVTDLIGEAT